MPPEIFNTERLSLKKLSPEQIAQLFHNEPREEFMKLFGLQNEEEYLREKHKIEGGYKTYDRSILHFLIVLKDRFEVIGRGGFHNWYPAHSKAELGYALYSDEHKQKGYMSEAVAFMLHYGFMQMDLNRIEACVGPTNTASLSLIRKFGFTQEGYLRKHYIKNGEVQDSLIFSLLKEEYKAP